MKNRGPQLWKEGAAKRHLNVHLCDFLINLFKILQKRGGRYAAPSRAPPLNPRVVYSGCEAAVIKQTHHLPVSLCMTARGHEQTSFFREEISRNEGYM